MILKERWDRLLCAGAVVVLLVVAAVSMLQVQQAERRYQSSWGELYNGDIFDLPRVRSEERYALRSLADVRLRIHPNTLLTDRDIFNPVSDAPEPVTPPAGPGTTHPDWEVVDIMFKQLALQYRGFAELPERGLVAQVNYDARSYLVSRGMRIAHYLVTALDKERIVLQRDGAIIRLPYRRIAYSNERMALIKDRRTQQVERVIKGDRILGFEVRDITPEEVLLSNQKETLLLRKGKVQP